MTNEFGVLGCFVAGAGRREKPVLMGGGGGFDRDSRFSGS
jgi:hypothetical protein